MEDIIGREVNENDLVIGMVIGRHSDGMRFGVYNGNSVNWRNGVTSVPCNVYLIENPSEKEQGIKQSIIDKVKVAKERNEEAKAKRRELKRMPTKDLVIGESYEDDRGYSYVYLGKGSVWEGNDTKALQGHIYLSAWYSRYNATTGFFDSLPHVAVLKNPKKLVKTSEKKTINYVFNEVEFILKESPRNRWGGYGSYPGKTLKFKLGGSQ